jgi:serine/threonine protein kinase
MGLGKSQISGITTEGTSDIPCPTVGHGTPGYRPPELVRNENVQYINKVDIWGLGCILFEVEKGKKVFPTDIAVHDYAVSSLSRRLSSLRLDETRSYYTTYIQVQRHTSIITIKLSYTSPVNS